jgi:hypothetical protein
MAIPKVHTDIELLIVDKIIQSSKSGLDFTEKQTKLMNEKFGKWSSITIDSPLNKTGDRASITQQSPLLAATTINIGGGINSNTTVNNSAAAWVTTSLSSSVGINSVTTSVDNSSAITKLQARIAELEAELVNIKKNKTHDTFSTDGEFDARSAYDRAMSSVSKA